MEIEHGNVVYRLAAAAKALAKDRPSALPMPMEAAATLWVADPSSPRRSTADLERQLKRPLEQWLPSEIPAAHTSGARGASHAR
ncbi:hypothetical protein INH39_26825 [Massilia violaceinigra]|uniref:Uncharacterized protein n=1 Tax=Massilia violaceinigra TaxID=2045208 RepID=A0ABY4AG08_9BURK|nr:hypothetical protein [Massilia violaceinigra]UOD33691.1 hypothetical protein INH39_26825 [Massilia violaceinigra]